MAIKSILIIICLIAGLPFASYAEVEVALFQYRDANGNIKSFEENGQFFHIAIKTTEGWLHASVFGGVTLVENINHIGVPLALILKNKNLPRITKKDYEKYLNIPFDLNSPWASNKSTYCSKLVANILDIPPLPMQNSQIVTAYNTIKLDENMGLSPDDLYKILTEERDFNIQQWQCSAIL